MSIAIDSTFGTQHPFALSTNEPDAYWTDTVVTQGHADYCEAFGHVGFTVTSTGHQSERCGRCGDLLADSPAVVQEPAPAVQEEAAPADTFESLLARMADLTWIPLDAREQFDAMLREHFGGLINEEAGDEAEASFEVGDRVLFAGAQGTANEDNVGTVRDVDGDHVRVRWDRPVAFGVTATWTAAARLVKVA